MKPDTLKGSNGIKDGVVLEGEELGEK